MSARSGSMPPLRCALEALLEDRAFLFGLVLLPAITLLQLVDEVAVIAGGGRQIGGGQPVPILLHRTPELGPVVPDDVLIHDVSPLEGGIAPMSSDHIGTRGMLRRGSEGPIRSALMRSYRGIPFASGSLT